MIVYAPELRKSRYGPRLDETEVEAGVDRGYCIYPGKRYGRDEIMESHRRFGTLGHPRGGTGIFFIIITHYGSRCIHNKRGFFFFLDGSSGGRRRRRARCLFDGFGFEQLVSLVMRACYDVLEYDREGGIRANDI